MNKQTGFGEVSPAAAKAAAGAGEGLAYAVELWDLTRARVELVLGRADSVEVASAIYEAAVREHPFRLVVLRRGPELVRSTA